MRQPMRVPPGRGAVLLLFFALVLAAGCSRKDEASEALPSPSVARRPVPESNKNVPAQPMDDFPGARAKYKGASRGGP
jgi:hypothetical protein